MDRRPALMFGHGLNTKWSYSRGWRSSSGADVEAISHIVWYILITKSMILSPVTSRATQSSGNECKAVKVNPNSHHHSSLHGRPNSPTLNKRQTTNLFVGVSQCVFMIETSSHRDGNVWSQDRSLVTNNVKRCMAIQHVYHLWTVC